MNRINQVFRIFSSLLPIATEIQTKGYAKANNMTLVSILQHHKGPSSKLALAVCATVDVYGPFVEATHFMESRKFISPFVYAKIADLKKFSETILKAKDCPTDLPNVYACLLKADPSMRQDLWLKYVLPGVRPGLTYFWKLFVSLESDVDMDDDDTPVCFREWVDMFRWCRIFDPKQGLAMLKGRDFVIDQWCEVATPSISKELWKACTDEKGLGRLIILYNEVLSRNGELNMDPASLLLFWQDPNNIAKAGPWAEAARVFILARPSSAFAESLFSLYGWCVSDYAMKSSEDTQELRVQLNQERLNRQNKDRF